MVARGRIENGVVVLADGVRLPEGQMVTVHTVAAEDVEPGPVSKERRDALLGLIGMLKMENPPSDEEVERIVEEERMKKYG
jgi:hypothetical protein